jgi:hypothetical protein
MTTTTEQPIVIPQPDVIRAQLRQYQQLATLLRRQLRLSIRAYPRSEIERRERLRLEAARAG